MYKRIAMKILPILPLFFLLMSCGGHKPDGTLNPVAPKPVVISGDPKAVVAELNGEAITQGELDAKISAEMSRLQNEVYEIKKQGINSIVEDKLLQKEAKKRSISVEELIKIEVQDKVGQMSDKEVEDFYNQNKPRFGNKTFEE